MFDHVMTRSATVASETSHTAWVDVDSDASPSPDTVPPLGNRLRMLVTGLLFSYFWAALCVGVLDAIQAGGNVGRVITYELDETRLTFLISSGVLWVVLIGLWALTNRLALAAGLLLAAVTVVGFADYQKLLVRHEPLYPSDISFARQTSFLTEMVGVRTVIVVVMVLFLEVLILVLLGRMFSRMYPRIRRHREPRRWWVLTGIRVVTLIVSIASIGYLTTFNSPDNKVRELYEASGTRWAFWFQTVNYARHGFVPGFLYNLNVPAMEVPGDYSAPTMDALSDKYVAKAERINAARAAGALKDVNVVVVLSEAFSDPTLLDGPTVSEDPIPYTRELMSRTTSGSMLAQLFGGGTANMEFEALTGFSLSQFLPQMNTPYQMLVTKRSTFPSAVGYLAADGHRPLAVHPYMTSMYKRAEVYPTLGFEDFVHDSTMQKAERIEDNEFISDASAFDEVRHQIDDSDDPVMLNLVTMQNHYPMVDNYDDPIPVGGVSEKTARQYSNYARGLRFSDDALRDFVSELEQSDEKTAVVFYGDHQPAFWDEDVYERNSDLGMRQTPFFLWTNFRDLPSGQTPPLTSPIYFLPMLFDQLGAPLPPWYVLLLELHEQVPAMEQGEYFLPTGQKVTEDELSARAQRLLRDYRLMQYDLAVGQRYSQSAMFYPDAG